MDTILLSAIFILSAAASWILWRVMKELGLSSPAWFGYHAAIWNWPKKRNKKRERQ